MHFSFPSLQLQVMDQAITFRNKYIAYTYLLCNRIPNLKCTSTMELKMLVLMCGDFITSSLYGIP